MSSSYHRNLLSKVMKLSEDRSSWENAVREWEIFDHEEDETATSSCVCGKEGLRYLFTIKNDINGNKIFPIGSVCINKFGREDLDSQTTVLEKLYKLHHAIEDGQYITLTSDYFSRNLLKYLYDNDVFVPNQYNNNDGFNDYNFLLKMFNRRNKDSSSEREERKVKALIMVIRNYLLKNIAHRIKQH